MEVWQIFISLDTLNKVPIIVPANCLIPELLRKIEEHPHIPVGTNIRLYTSDGRSFEDNKVTRNQRLSVYNIRDKSTLNLSVGLIGGDWPTINDLQQQTRNPRPSEKIKITTAAEHPDVCGLDDVSPRVIMPCGHAIAPHSLAVHCLYELEAKKSEIACPDCKSIWLFSLIREAACLSENEAVEFEQRLLANKQNANVRQCPTCLVPCHRVKDTDKRVACLNCQLRNEAHYEFCWNCLRQWKSPGWDTCGNSDCDSSTALTRILADCKTIKLLGLPCPSLRACPRCFLNIELISGCKHMTCKRCEHEFCFICLKTHDWKFQPCDTCDVAPRQTVGITDLNRPLQAAIIAPSHGYRQAAAGNTYQSEQPHGVCLYPAYTPPQPRAAGISSPYTPLQKAGITSAYPSPKTAGVTFSNEPQPQATRRASSYTPSHTAENSSPKKRSCCWKFKCLGHT